MTFPFQRRMRARTRRNRGERSRERVGEAALNARSAVRIYTRGTEGGRSVGGRSVDRQLPRVGPRMDRPTDHPSSYSTARSLGHTRRCAVYNCNKNDFSGSRQAAATAVAGGERTLPRARRRPTLRKSLQYVDDLGDYCCCCCPEQASLSSLSPPVTAASVADAVIAITSAASVGLTMQVTR